MTCESVRPNLWLYESGETSPRLAEEVRAHLETCAACRKELESLRRLSQALKASAPARTEADWDRLQRDILRRIDERADRPRVAWPRLAPAFAALLLLAGSFGAYRLHRIRQTDEIVKNLDVLEHLELLERDDLFNEKTR